MKLPFGLGAKLKKSAKGQDSDRGVLAFSHTAEVIRAEAALRAAGFAVRVMGPPPDMRTGCGQDSPRASTIFVISAMTIPLTPS